MKSIVITLLLALFVTMLMSSVRAEVPVYVKGQGEVHNTSCTPPTHRAVNADGVQVEITEAELANGTLYLYRGGDIFTTGILVVGDIVTDIRCNHAWQIDALPADEYYVFATVTDTDGRTSEVSLEGGPFSSLLPLMPPAAPTGVQ